MNENKEAAELIEELNPELVTLIENLLRKGATPDILMVVVKSVTRREKGVTELIERAVLHVSSELENGV